MAGGSRVASRANDVEGAPRVRYRPLTIVALLIIAAGCAGDDAPDGGALKPIEPDGPRGSIDLVQRGERISGTIRLEGLDPGSAHAAHLHGAPGGQFSCAGERTPAHLINFPDLVADDAGVAELSLDITAPAATLRPGTYVMVHERPRVAGEVATEAEIVPAGMAMDMGVENPPIACGDVQADR